MNILHEKELNYEYWYYLDKYNNRIFHRDNDLPAVIYSNGDKCWYQHGKNHREAGAAVEWYDGGLLYYYHDKYLGRSFEGYTQKDFEQYKKLIVFL